MNGQRRNVELSPKQSDPPFERKRLLAPGPFSFRKDEYVVSPVHRFACMAKAPLKSTVLRQGEDIVKPGDEEIGCGAEEIEEPVALIPAQTEVQQHFTTHRN